MTFFAFIFSASETGVPVWFVVVAMLCDTILLCTAMATGLIHT